MGKESARSGFTLVELTVVIAIISILAVISIANLMRVRMNANEGSIKKELKTFSSANESYRAAQNPVDYAPTVTALTAAVPPYLDPTWNAMQRKGFDLTYSWGGAGATTYSMFAKKIPNLAENDYCVDQTGVIFRGGAGAPTGCVGGAAVGS